MRARLLCRVRSGETRSFDLAGDEAVIGRDLDLAVALGSEEVSRRHARISWDGKSHWLEDLQSSNGTFLNGRRVLREREKLRHLSVLTLGRETDLIFVLRREETQALRRTVIQHAFLVRNVKDALPCEVPVGEFTVGRSAACNLVSESAEVSKVHARLTRAADKLIVRDLGSANGTARNGVRVAEAPLVDGDLLAFAGEEYRVSLAMGEVTSTTLSLAAEEVGASLVAKQPEPEAPRFSTDWKQRVEGQLEQAAAMPERPVDVTSRGSTRAESLAMQEPAGVTAGRIEVRLLGPEVDLVVIGAGSYVIGSGAGAPLRVNHPRVAEAHARLIVSDALGGVFVQSEGGRTLRNGQNVERPEPLTDGDVLELGEARLKVGVRRVG